MIFLVFIIGLVTAIFYITYENIMTPDKIVILDVTNDSSQNIKKISIKATDGSGKNYGTVTYYNLKQNTQIFLPIVFNRDGSFIVNYTLDNNLTFEKNYPYVMVGDTKTEVITDKGISPDKFAKLPNKN